MSYKLIVFDADGTLIETISGATFRKGADDWKWLPGRLGRLHELRRQGVRLAVATNQGGAASGYMKQADILAELQKMCCEAEIPAGGLYICYSHPKAKLLQYRYEDARRKPGPGMLREAMADFEADPSETLYVGDRPEDEQSAHNAGVAFMWADEFFQ